MKFQKHLPSPALQSFIKHYVVSENDVKNDYNVLPSTGLVLGFQYSGLLSTVHNNQETNLASAGITGLMDGFKTFRNTAATGTILVYFTETGFAHFASHPANELFNLSIGLDYVFDKQQVRNVEELLNEVKTDIGRIKIIEKFLLSNLNNIKSDKLITEAVRLIYSTKGTIRIREQTSAMFISQSPFEKRFRKVLGTSPKKFASIVRFHTVLNQMSETKSLMEICFENNFFDQAHFIKDFKRYTGSTPENFKRFQ